MEEHLLDVARWHGRPVADLPSTPRLPGCSASGSREEQAKPLPPHEAEPDHSGASMPATSPRDVDLMQKLSCLETRVMTFQEQLALALLQERELSVEHRIMALETITAELVGRLVFSASLPDPQCTGTGQKPASTSPSPRPLNPAEHRAQSRMPPLIEYGVQGTYVIISAQEGELHFVPDSPELFEWLVTISSFRFVGQQGCFTAYRDTQHRCPTRFWRAYYYIHQCNYKRLWGVTEALTPACLE